MIRFVDLIFVLSTKTYILIHMVHFLIYIKLLCYYLTVVIIFRSFQIDVNNDGVVQIHELQQFMGNFLRPSLAKYIACQIHKKYDTNSDGMLSFDEFYEMSLRKDYKFHRLLFQYCKYVVPQKQRSTGKEKRTFLWPFELCRQFCALLFQMSHTMKVSAFGRHQLR